MKKLMGFETVRLPTLFFYIPQMKEKHRGLEQHVKKWWKNFHFGVNWPFKCLLQYRYIYINTLMNEWMNASMMHLYSALLCIAVHPKHFTIMWGGGGLSSTATSVQHPLGWCNGCHRTTAPVRSPHTSYRWRGERVIEPIKWMGIIRRPWLTRSSGGNLTRTPGLQPYSLREVPWDF